MKKKLIDWLMPSIADAIVLRLLFNTLGVGSLLLNDGDTGWHIVTGERILQTFTIPFVDPYSHTMPGISWTAHEWLAEIVFALVHRAMGLNGVVLLTVVVICFTSFFLYRYLLHRRVNPIIAAFFTVIAAWASTIHWLARPHIFSLPMTFAFFVILELYQRDKRDYLKFLPVLMVVWVNLHGGYILGLVLILIYIGGNLVISFAGSRHRQYSRLRLRKISIIGAVTLIATFLNPRGPAILYFPFHLVGRQYIMDNVSEWISPDFHKYTVFEFMLLVFLAVLVLSKKRPDIFEGALSLLLVHMSLYSARYIPLLALVVTPIVAIRAADVLDRLTRHFSAIGFVNQARDISSKISTNVANLENRFNRHLWIYVATVACVLVGLNGGYLGKIQLMDYRHEATRFPVEALNFAMENGVTGNMFNNDGWGGYIIYKSYPQYSVFMDGRSDMYGVPFLKEYVKVAGVHLECQEVLDKYNVGWVIFNANSPLCQFLVATEKWKLVYADTTANVLVRDISSHRELIEKYTDVVFIPKSEALEGK